MIHVLVIEDEKKTRAFLSRGLAEHGFTVDAAEDGESGLQMALGSQYDMIILDIMLPRFDGWSVLAELRRKKKETPVLLLTARDAVADRVKGLELGADDYLVKPFAFAELVARIRTVLRRAPGGQAGMVRVADLTIDLVRQRATRAGQKLELTPREFMLLSLLARRRGEVQSRNMIQALVWDIHFESAANVVDVHIRRLRAKVDEPFQTRLIHTVRGVGYVLELRD